MAIVPEQWRRLNTEPLIAIDHEEDLAHYCEGDCICNCDGICTPDDESNDYVKWVDVEVENDPIPACSTLPTAYVDIDGAIVPHLPPQRTDSK